MLTGMVGAMLPGTLGQILALRERQQPRREATPDERRGLGS